jgi:sulfite exporter TauE/SafE
MTESIGLKLKVASVFIFLGFLMTLGMTATTLLNPGGGDLYEVRLIGNVIADLVGASAQDINIKLAALVFDNFFMIGYLCIFYGLYLLTRDGEKLIAKVAFLLGSLTFLTDMIENAIQVALLTGVPNGWVPTDSVFSSLWVVMYVKDISSYMAGFTFIVLLLVFMSNPPEFRTSKLVFVILLGLYVGLGVIAIIEPSFLLFRNLSFMIDLLIASLLFRQLAARFQD